MLLDSVCHVTLHYMYIIGKKRVCVLRKIADRHINKLVGVVLLAHLQACVHIGSDFIQ